MTPLRRHAAQLRCESVPAPRTFDSGAGPGYDNLLYWHRIAAERTMRRRTPVLAFMCFSLSGLLSGWGRPSVRADLHAYFTRPTPDEPNSMAKGHQLTPSMAVYRRF